MTREELLARVKAQWVDYPWLADSWDDWVVATVQRRIWRFGTSWLERGEVTLVAPAGYADGSRGAYSFRGMVDIPVKPEDVRAHV